MSYTGTVLRIDLTTGKATKEPLNKEWAREYIGGKGLSIKYLYEELKPGVDPLSPDNKLILMTGPTTGTIVPNSVNWPSQPNHRQQALYLIAPSVDILHRSLSMPGTMQ
jgi:hypothetical protein